MGSCCRRRKCLCCNELFTPDYRNRGRQRYCSKGPCQRARKKASQAAWLAKATNGDYFRGAANTERNRQWRDRHPGYWRSSQRHCTQASRTQQDACFPQVTDNQPTKPTLTDLAQQDACLTQVPVFVGLMAILTDCTQQDAIDQSARRLHLLGSQILARSTTIGATSDLLASSPISAPAASSP
jgi:hypothetical protein